MDGIDVNFGCPTEDARKGTGFLGCPTEDARKGTGFFKGCQG